MDSLQKPATRARISNRELVDGLQRALEQKYSGILRAAGNEWERRFAGDDPSDSCVSVRISTWGRALSGGSSRGPRGLPPFTSQAV